MEKELPVGHKQLIDQLMDLPKLSMLLWTLEQKEYFDHRRTIWKYFGARIDYLQRRQLGFRPIDPATVLEAEKRQYIEVHSNYLFNWLQICNKNFVLIQRQAQQHGRNFPFQNPRELFAAICRDFSDREVQEGTSREINQGRTLTEIRAGAKAHNKLFRGGFSEQENTIIQKTLAEDGSWGGIVIAAIIGMKPGQRKNQSEWKEFQKAHKQLAAYLRTNQTRAIKWNAGHSVWADTDSPVLLSSA